ncbi:MAG: hypothetical protein ACAI38_15980 [Myxococcota bacterium]|nr:hypothetical protein [Myxococcota bacterium]
MGCALLPRPEQRQRRASERGAALILVVILVVVMLIGGLALVGVTNSELSSSRGFRAHAVTDACVEAAVEKVRALLPDVQVASFSSTGGDLAVGSQTLHYEPGHITGPSSVAVYALDGSQFDIAALYAGENITNVMGTTATGTSGEALRIISSTVVCSGNGYGTRELQVVFKYGTPMGMR